MKHILYLFLTALCAVFLFSSISGARIGFGRSMEPYICTGDIVILRPAETYEVGDVIAFRRGWLGLRTVGHRIVGYHYRGGYYTKGDNCKYADPWVVREEDIIGKEVRVIRWIPRN